LKNLKFAELYFHSLLKEENLFTSPSTIQILTQQHFTSEDFRLFSEARTLAAERFDMKVKIKRKNLEILVKKLKNFSV
jgi:hypothetical protein